MGSEESLTSELLHKSKIKKELDVFGDELIIDICVPYEGSLEVLETKVSACMRNKIALKDTEARHAFYSSYKYNKYENSLEYIFVEVSFYIFFTLS